MAHATSTIGEPAMRDDAANDALISAFYEAALDRSQWETALSQFARLTDADGATILLGDLSIPVAQVSSTFGNDPDALAAYNSYYCKLDPLTQVAVKLTPGQWFNDWRDCGRRFSANTEYYADFARRFRLQANMGTLLLREGTVIAALSAQRSGNQGPFTRDDEAVGVRLFPHLARAARIAWRLDQLNVHGAMSSAALACLSIPVFILDAQCVIVYANDAALALIRDNTDARCAEGHLTLGPHADRFAHAVAQAACEPGTAAIIPTQCGSVGSMAHAFILPLSAHALLAELWQRPLSLVIVPDDSGSVLPSSVLRQLFGLTPAECRVARSSAAGRMTAEVADELDVSTETVRCQLKSVFAKTGTRRQSELARLLSRLEVVQMTAYSPK
jgi:DNA-binding CsgD family transcriptional regulator/PAS domain-containing protein